MIDLYERVLTVARIIGKGCGYAVTLHGSGIRDLDLVAIPWTDECRYTPREFMEHLIDSLVMVGMNARSAHFTKEYEGEIPENCKKPHGRLAFIIWIDHTYCVDLSIMPRMPK